MRAERAIFAPTTLEQTLENIRPADSLAGQAAQAHWDAIAKPLGGLGLLEEAICRIAAITGEPAVRIDRRTLVVLCADNGVVAEGVSQSGSEVTAIVAENICEGLSSACRMAQTANCQVLPVDLGMLTEVAHPRLLRHRIASGTGNIAQGPAMTRAQAVQAIEVGVALAHAQKEAGCMILATGEMGIGNTTTSSAVAAVLLGEEPALVTGRGAGLSSEGLQRKVAVIEQAIAVNRPDPDDPLDVLAKLGGFDLAGMCGLFLGGAALGLPLVLDGFISGVAALCAVRLAPACRDYLLASHLSAEPAARLILRELQLKPLIAAEMHLGEGTGAVTLLPLLDLALAVYHGSSTFAASQIEAYQPQE